MKILSGIDVHYSPGCGSILLAQDLYAASVSNHDVRFMVLEPLSDLDLPQGWQGLPLRKELWNGNRDIYQEELNRFVDKCIADFSPELLHCQHLCYGMTKALIRHPTIPKLGVCHGTDVIEAIRSDKFRADLQQIVSVLDRIIFPSRGILADARTVADIPDHKVAVIPWGLPDRYFAEGRHLASYDNQPFSVLYAGRFDESKGIDVLLEGFRRTSGRLQLTLIGAGALGADIRRWITQAGIEGRVELRPWLGRDELQAEFARHQLLVLPSRQIEAFGLVCAEAQAAALPVIVSQVSGLPEVIPESLDILKFESGDAEGLAQRIEAISSDERLWQNLSQRCLANAQRFTMRACKRQLAIESARLIHG